MLDGRVRIRTSDLKIPIILDSLIRILIKEKDGSGFTSKENQDPDPDPHQSEKVEALEGNFGALEDPILGKRE
jgi:hypothetical protein